MMAHRVFSSCKAASGSTPGAICVSGAPHSRRQATFRLGKHKRRKRAFFRRLEPEKSCPRGCRTPAASRDCRTVFVAERAGISGQTVAEYEIPAPGIPTVARTRRARP